MTYTVQPPERRKYRILLVNMRAGERLLLPDASPGSLKTIASRLNGRKKKPPQYQTAKEGNGVRVWRTL